MRWNFLRSIRNRMTNMIVTMSGGTMALTRADAELGPWP